MEDKLPAANRQLRNIIEFLPEAAFAIDREGRVIAWNKAIEEMSGMGKKDILGQGDYAYAVPFYGIKRPILINMIFPKNQNVEGNYEHFERKDNVIRAGAPCHPFFNGRGAYLWCTAWPLLDGEGNLIGAIESIRDITECKQFEKKLEYLSRHDPLTGLYNRSYFVGKIKQAGKGHVDPFGIIVCDLDGLKLVNETLGINCGDKLLKASANLIKGVIRENDLLARIGGDEFAIILPHSDEKTVEKTCSRIRGAIKRYNEADPEIPLSISIGHSIKGGKPGGVIELFREANSRMHCEKLHRSQSARSAIAQTLMKTMEARDLITGGHAVRLEGYVTALAKAIGMPPCRITRLNLLAKFHDIGKVGVPDRILFKPGPLTWEEFAIMRRHSEIGHHIAQSSRDLATIADLILKHHEWWDGNGYPLGLKGREIPIECRVLAIADAFDAMISDRPYRKALPRGKAIEELKDNAGIQFDPRLVHCFLEQLEGDCNQSDTMATG